MEAKNRKEVILAGGVLIALFAATQLSASPMIRSEVRPTLIVNVVTPAERSFQVLNDTRPLVNSIHP